MNNFMGILAGLRGKTLKNVVITVVLGSKTVDINVAQVICVNEDMLEVAVEGIDYRSVAANNRRFFRTCDVVSLALTPEV
jgi:alpha-D-ribose 1-methylphosphonate 5-phosphate C-P lyase